MRTSSSRNTAKFFAPALLLTAGLALPVSAARAANDGGMAIDGYLSDSQNSNCIALREHDGGTRYLTGAINGLQSGDHVRLYARSIDGSACNVRGNAYEVTEVLTLWGDDRHKTTYYDHQTNGSFESYAYQNNRISGQGQNSRYGRNRSGDNQRYDNRSGYDQRSNRGGELVSLTGRLSNDGSGCPVLETRDGQVWNLQGDMPRYRDRTWVKVVGWTAGYDSSCGGQALRVRQISRR
jgi:hypothetical protein